MFFVGAFCFYLAGGARGWTRQALWYMPCGEGVCVTCHDFVVSMQHVSMFDYAGSAQPWARQAPCYLPCGEAVCVVCC